MLLQYHDGLTMMPQSFMLLISRFCGATKTYITNDAGRQICRVSKQSPTLQSSVCSPVCCPSKTYKPSSHFLRKISTEPREAPAAILHPYTRPPHLPAFRMHLLTLLLSLLPLTSAFLIPASLPDGLYLAPINGTSAADIQRVDLDALVASHAESATSRRGSRVDRRQDRTKYVIERTNRMFPNHDDYNQCTEAWRTFFANGGVVKGHFLFLCTQGEAVIAGCNYRSESLLSSSAEFSMFEGRVVLTIVVPDNDFNARYTNPTLVDFFNSVADRTWGEWTTGWVRIKYYDYSFIDFTFWRDLRGTQFCTDLP